jgi:2-oxo-4-hydroxy-4-carboxy-5-ureidoimidazoline decarboxylase
MTSRSEALTCAALNAMDRSAFRAALDAIFESSPWVAERVSDARPFADVADLHAAMCAAVRQASEAEQLALLRAHPDLAGRAARANAMSSASVTEQALAGLDRLTDEEFSRFERLNTAYRERFGFPFIIAVRQRDKASILAAYERRLPNTRQAEMATALDEVFAITRMRLQATVQ